jgi:hypothetical protein
MLVEVGEQEQVFDEVVHAVGLSAHATDHVVERGPSLEAAFAVQVEVATDRRQRCAQFVRGVGDEHAEPFFGGVSFVEHDVERGGQLAGFGARVGDDDAVTVVAAGDGVGGGGEAGDGTQAESLYPPHGDDEHGGDSDEDAAERPAESADGIVDFVERQCDDRQLFGVGGLDDRDPEPGTSLLPADGDRSPVGVLLELGVVEVERWGVIEQLALYDVDQAAVVDRADIVPM